MTVDDEIYLKPLEKDDAIHIFETINTQRKYMQEWLPFVPYTRELYDSLQYVDYVLNMPDEYKEEVYTILYHNEFCGIIGLKPVDWNNMRSEFGYWLSQPFQGKGIVTRCVQRLLHYAFNDLKINRIQIKCAVGNVRSSNIPKRLGFTFEGIEREGERYNDQRYFDIEVYSLLQREFLSKG
ncbi:GNAT family N-acetyltransferase [Bacteroidales bacterium OttesenSCG-928-B11]|nr:GNAT family N-acetyltransferase [Bacteroidales bacterium OttesenSCG-928-C03]MDL2311630.1 GNAT family N-acetyltransferase [Bacteroidales bacterium OttesenSCG-928-B11]